MPLTDNQNVLMVGNCSKVSKTENNDHANAEGQRLQTKGLKSEYNIHNK